jgi:hypothetical protein
MKFSKEEAQQEAWYRGNLSWKFHASQRLINKTFNSVPGNLFVGNCSRQFGKSFWAVCKAIEQAIKTPKSQIRYGAAFQTDLLEFIIPAFDKILEDCPASIRGKYKVSGSRYIFPNGSKIKLVGLDKNPNGLRGNTLDMIILDECGFVSNLDYVYKSVIIPSTTHRPNCKIILISTPPSTPAHPFIDYVQKAEAEQAYAKFTIYENPMVGADTIARLMHESGGEHSTTWRREYMCELITDADSQIIPEWHEKYIVDTKEDEFYPFYHRYVGMDLGVKDFTLVIFGYYDFKRATLVIQDEVKLNGPQLTTLILKDTIAAYEQRLWPDRPAYRRISDNNNPQLIQDLAIMHRMSFVSTDKDKLETMLNEVRMMVNNGQVEVNPRCTQLIGCLNYGVWDAKKKAFARSSVYGHFDALAALTYLVRNLDRHANPVPSTYGFDVRNSRIRTDKKNHSEGAKLMGNLFHKPTRRA